MKQSKICPKCGGQDILRVKDASGDNGVNLVLGILSWVQVPRYVCCDCGYVESWVDKEDLYILKDKLRKQREKENR